MNAFDFSANLKSTTCDRRSVNDNVCDDVWDEVLVKQAKVQAARRGKSVSQMFGEFVVSLEGGKRIGSLPPITKSLLGVMKGENISEKDYKTHLQLRDVT